MSLINKMLQDLDARGTAAGEVYPPQARPVTREVRMPAPRVLGGVAAAIAVAGLAGWLGWQQLHRAAPVTAVALKPSTVPVVASPVAAVVPVTPPQAVLPLEVASVPVQAPPTERAAAAEPAMHAASALVAPARIAPARIAPAPADEAPRGRTFEPMEPDSAQAREARRVMTALLAARQPAPMPKAVARAAAEQAAARGRRAEDSGAQGAIAARAEAAYRRALARLQDGRMGETVAALEETLRIDPGHEAARQTLVGLLIEDGRTDDAMRQLQQGLAQDARQPALAMLLARLQIERGAGGIETLMRTLPYAGNDPDYHAFLGGALERQGRHREAAEHYLVAVRALPTNGVWWMGLGIALQADKHDGDALEAFRKAQASGSLNGELAAFVERRIQQLGR